jgi:predicted deacylase
MPTRSFQACFRGTPLAALVARAGVCRRAGSSYKRQGDIVLDLHSTTISMMAMTIAAFASVQRRLMMITVMVSSLVDDMYKTIK